MKLILGFFFVEIFLILCAEFFQESTGLSPQSFSMASLLHPITVKAPERLYGGKWRFILQQNAPPPSSHKINISNNAHKHHHLRQKAHHISPKPYHQLPQGPAVSSSPSPISPSDGRISEGHLPLPAIPPIHHVNTPSSPSPSPSISPMSSPVETNEKSLPPIPSLTLPPPPLNQRCISITCSEPLTYMPPGAPCGCVWPIEIRLCFSMSLYTFFPLVFELSKEIAAAIPLDRSQVRIVGADAVDQQLEKTSVLVKLVPMEQYFKAETAFDIYTKFWKRDISIRESLFGVYETLYVRYPGGGRLLALKSGVSSASMSFSSSLMACTGSAKVFSIDDIKRATDNFNTSRILGEGGFGLVYGGVLDDGRKVAVKVLKRDDQQGSREFLAEVEMLSRLHHRNLVKLIGICPEDQCRCLMYELVPNGSVESHLHGVDKEIAPLDWSARMKIALGAARGLAYLHEDSSPRVIHRDFKSSNILLEHDYTPKVSDFGLARTALDEGNKHISTHVMGTFGYLAPEYAMTGHLLVKSDVYSYGVVLLELLTGRKPVDLSQPPGQENLVSWARPLLASNNGLETIIDPNLKANVPLDSVSKVAAITSMCVQPEVSHRPFMGEVVQALKLVCNDFEETREQMSRSCSQEFSVGIESKHSRLSNELVEALDKCDSPFDTKIALSAVDLKSVSAGFEGQESESFRRQFNSAPLIMGRKRKFWHKLQGLSRGSMSEHE